VEGLEIAGRPLGQFFTRMWQILRQSAKGHLELEHYTTDGDHDRIEERHHTVCRKVDWLFSDRRYADEPRFPHLAMIGMVETRVQRNGTVARERRYYLS
jgi:hypothetical protein